jgi:hypothetical protein
MDEAPQVTSVPLSKMKASGVGRCVDSMCECVGDEEDDEEDEEDEDDDEEEVVCSESLMLKCGSGSCWFDCGEGMFN